MPTISRIERSVRAKPSLYIPNVFLARLLSFFLSLCLALHQEEEEEEEEGNGPSSFLVLVVIYRCSSSSFLTAIAVQYSRTREEKENRMIEPDEFLFFVKDDVINFIHKYTIYNDVTGFLFLLICLKKKVDGKNVWCVCMAVEGEREDFFLQVVRF